jgi:hypothetical protein
MNTDKRVIRPRTIAEMQICLQGFATEESVRRGLAYKPHATDVFISPYSKCGTTWMQQIVHGLRSGGSMDFDEITEVTPWVELAHDMGWGIDAPQIARPHVFKSHLDWHDIPKGGRYIVVLRDPVDAMVSLYNFFDGWFFERGSIPVSDFAGYYLDRGKSQNYWGHACSWWAQREAENILLVCFEHMKQNLPATVGRVANFLDASITPQTRALAAEQAGFEFMKRHERQFDDHLVREARDPACGLPPGGDASKVIQGKSGAGKAMISDAILQEFDTRWRDTMGRLGVSSYDNVLQQVSTA